MKYCGVSTPFCGVRVYVRSAMGMPRSETALEELTCRVLGHLVQEGVVAKIADDLYCGGNSPEELLTNWERVLQALQKCSLNLSATKTIIAPKQATILGWIWELGSIRASPHRIATLSNCQPPKTVRALRSFVGAYKVLSRVIKNSSGLLSLLENAVAGSESKDTILWTEELNSAFTSAQNALSTNRSIALPRPNDQLWIVTDGALKTCGLGATLYINRNDKLLLAGFFSAKLRQTQRQWLPCEIEALSIAASIKHFSPYIIQSLSTACVLTESKPCVQAFEKLCRGEFSSSPRIIYKVAYEVSQLENIQRLLRIPHSDDDDDERVNDISSPSSVPVIPKAISDLPTLPSVIPHQNTQLENVEHSLSINSPDINLSNDNCAINTTKETCIDSQENELKAVYPVKVCIIV
ncbi:unnamed protein product [Mytilus edulis]|uniref:Reverse transcriptase/retrotransposon-derived protein RNase H-like domain-containing protein n=1 Tax=Mytilus edulis TaxID=6550 RepID=A0A8S3UV12_MYTED|nr:unnamed protein product [Mytilus edulis]